MSELSKLELARENVKLATERIQDQVTLIEKIKADGHDTSAAERLLATFLDVSDLFAKKVEELERLSKRPK